MKLGIYRFAVLVSLLAIFARLASASADDKESTVVENFFLNRYEHKIDLILNSLACEFKAQRIPWEEFRAGLETSDPNVANLPSHSAQLDKLCNKNFNIKHIIGYEKQKRGAKASLWVFDCIEHVARNELRQTVVPTRDSIKQVLKNLIPTGNSGLSNCSSPTPPPLATASLPTPSPSGCDEVKEKLANMMQRVTVAELATEEAEKRFFLEKTKNSNRTRIKNLKLAKGLALGVTSALLVSAAILTAISTTSQVGSCQLPNDANVSLRLDNCYLPAWVSLWGAGGLSTVASLSLVLILGRNGK